MLASTGSNICVSKDWIVVISGGNKDKLASMKIHGPKYPKAAAP